ncbi:MAG: hypothetical protein IPO95_01950 [Rhodanobacteraceae bacterium]|nr:hypothetical protein [Rhodanobacteraceae bacterium]
MKRALPLYVLALSLSVAVAGRSPGAALGGGTDFTPHGTQPGLQSVLQSSGDCYGCHAGFFGQQQKFMPHSTWSGSMMAHAGRDPLFWAALDVANRDIPGVGDYCLRCHAPEGWYGGRVAKSVTGTPLDGANGCLLTGDHDDPDYGGNDYAGVGCHLCHRQQETGTLPPGVRHDSGQLFIDDGDCNGEGEPCRIGPYRYPEAGIVTPPHANAYAAFVKRGEFCGSCHDVTSPITSAGPARTLIDATGNDTGIPFPIERTASEWSSSDFGDTLFVDGFAENEPVGDVARFGQTCQSCHMPQSTDPDTMACQQNNEGSRTGHLGRHDLVGANAWVLGLIRDLYGGVAGLSRELEIDQAIARTLDLLTQHSAQLDVTLDPFAGPGNTLTARVRVTNKTGHKLPTGYSEGRRMWLNVQARDGNGALLFESGAYDASTGTLTEDAQARVYEVQQGIWNAATSHCDIRDGSARKMFHFALNNCIAKDNRIPPRGFRGGNDPELKPVAHVYPETSPGSGRLVNYDDATWVIPIAPGTVLPISVEARLQHQVASREYIEFLNNEAIEHAIPSENLMCQSARPPLATGPRTQTRAQFMFDLWTNNGRSPPVVMAYRIATTP